MTATDLDCPACRGSLVVRVPGSGLNVVPCPDLAGVHERARGNGGHGVEGGPLPRGPEEESRDDGVIPKSDEYDGCPCRTYGPCCADPQPAWGHELFCECDDDYCDYHWHARCDNCGAECGCNV